MTVIRWKIIPGYRCYAASACGRIKLLQWPRGRAVQGTRVRPGMELRQYRGKYYNTVCLYNDKLEYKTVTVHRLVALAWVPNPKNSPLVRHRDGISRRNHYKNLVWGDDLANTIDMMKHGRCQNQNGPPIFTPAQVRDLRILHANTRIKLAELARQTGVPYWSLRDMLRGRTYTWVK